MDENLISAALVTAQGDIFIAAAYLKVTPRQLDSYIRASDGLKNLQSVILKVKASDEYSRSTQEQFAAEVEHKLALYRSEAVDEIHALATMPMLPNAQMMDVKLRAAIALKDSVQVRQQGLEQANLLAELNAAYKANAPKIKSVQVAQIEFQDTPEYVE